MSQNIYKYERNVRVWSDVILKGCPIAAGRGRLPTAHVSAGIPRWFYPCYSLCSDDRLTRCWRSSEQYLLFPWSPGDGQATSPRALAALGPKRRKAHWGAASLSPWRWGERPAATQARTFLVSNLASLRSPPCLTAISCKLWSPPTPAPNPFTPSLFVVFFKAWARAKADNSPPLFVLAVLLFWGLLGTVVRCEIRPSSPGRTCEGMYRRGTARSAQTLQWFFLSEGVKAPFPKALSFQILTLSAAGKIKNLTALPLEVPIIYVIIPLMSDAGWLTETHTFKCKCSLILVIISIFKPSQFLIV